MLVCPVCFALYGCPVCFAVYAGLSAFEEGANPDDPTEPPSTTADEEGRDDPGAEADG